MIGAALVAVAVLVVLPASFWLTWGLIAFLIGRQLKDNAEATHPGSELIDTNI